MGKNWRINVHQPNLPMFFAAKAFCFTVYTCYSYTVICNTMMTLFILCFYWSFNFVGMWYVIWESINYTRLHVKATIILHIVHSTHHIHTVILSLFACNPLHKWRDCNFVGLLRIIAIVTHTILFLLTSLMTLAM